MANIVENKKEGDLRIWWIPQVPGKPFYVYVNNLEEAKLVNDILADYDKFQFENNIKPDYCNAGGLEIVEDGEWIDWYDEQGNSFDEYIEMKLYEDNDVEYPY